MLMSKQEGRHKMLKDLANEHMKTGPSRQISKQETTSQKWRKTQHMKTGNISPIIMLALASFQN